MPPKKGKGVRKRKGGMTEEDSDDEETVPMRKASKKKDDNYVWEEGDYEEVEAASKKGRKKNAVVWNDNDCRADVCLRPPGTSRWVCCDACSGWFHVPCLFLPEEHMALLDTDKEYYCPFCVQDKIKEFDDLRARLSVKVEGLATVQSEFGGVTISRDMFEEKKNATSYNYSKEFPATLRDLVARIGDFKYDYQQMVARLGPLLKTEHESRLTFIQLQLDEIAEDVLKPETSDQEDADEEEDIEEEDVEEEEGEGEPQLEFDLEWVKKEQAQQGRSASLTCHHCSAPVTQSACYSCVRRHLICVSCRSLHPGCVCPVCAEAGDRRRLFQGTRGKRRRKEDSKEALINLGLSKRKVPVEDVGSPQIMRVWSCTEENTLAVQPPLGEITLEGPVVKQEPAERQVQQEELYLNSDQREETEGNINVSTVLPKSMMSQQLLDLIDSTLNGGVEMAEEGNSEDQQPTNYNDTEALAEQQVAKIQTPLLVSSKERALMSAREELSSMMMLPSTPALEREMAQMRQRIDVLRKEVLVEEEELTNQHQQVLDPWTDQPLVQQEQHLEEDRAMGHHEVLDPWAALQSLQSAERRTSLEEARRKSLEGMRRASLECTSSGDVSIRRASLESEELQESWRDFKERAQNARPSTSNENLTLSHPIQSLPPAPPLKRAPHHPALRGCRFEPLESFRDQRFDGTITFSMLKDYSGHKLEWRSFLQLGQKFTLQLGRAGHVFYVRGLGEEKGHQWHLHISQTMLPQLDAVDVKGQFGNPGAPLVLPLNIKIGDVRDYQLHLTLATV